MSTIAVAIVCKTPKAGRSKTRLSPPLLADECARLSACFIRDLSHTIAVLAKAGDVTGYAVYTPLGSETALRALLPRGFELVPQFEGDFGERLAHGMIELLRHHSGAILVNSDSPTLPEAILRTAVEAVKSGDRVVLSPAHDGGYTLIGLSELHPRLFEEIPWSTPAVYPVTLERAAELQLPVVEVPGWYDIDDAASLQLLEDEFANRRPTFTRLEGARAPATRRFLRERHKSDSRA